VATQQGDAENKYLPVAHARSESPVTEAHIEAIVTLLYYGVDPLQRYPQRHNNACAMDDASVHYHNRAGDPTSFHLVATLLSSSIIKTAQGKKDYMITGGNNEQSFGIDPNAPILDHSKAQGKWDTGLTMAIKITLPYTVRYLIKRRSAEEELGWPDPPCHSHPLLSRRPRSILSSASASLHDGHAECAEVAGDEGPHVALHRGHAGAEPRDPPRAR
jgi:hypothetical protein